MHKHIFKRPKEKLKKKKLQYVWDCVMTLIGRV